MEQKRRIIVFGATGTLGLYTIDHLVNRLDPDEWEIVATGRRDVRFFGKYGSRVSYVRLDISEKKSFSLLPEKGVYAIIHYAGALPAYMKGYDPYQYVKSNVLGTLNVLEYARRVGADRIVYTETISDYDGYFNERVELLDDMPRRIPLTGDHSVYAITKCAAEDLCWNYQAEYGLKCFAFRLPNIYCYMPECKTLYHDGKPAVSSYRLMIRNAMAGKPLEVWGDPGKGMDLIYVKDFCQMVEKALFVDRPLGGMYNVGTGVLTTLDDFVHEIAAVFSPAGEQVDIIYRPEKHDCVNYFMNVDKARRELGYSPQYDRRAFLDDYRREMQKSRFAAFFEERYGERF